MIWAMGKNFKHVLVKKYMGFSAWDIWMRLVEIWIRDFFQVQRVSGARRGEGGGAMKGCHVYFFWKKKDTERISTLKYKFPIKWLSEKQYWEIRMQLYWQRSQTCCGTESEQERVLVFLGPSSIQGKVPSFGEPLAQLQQRRAERTHVEKRAQFWYQRISSDWYIYIGTSIQIPK